MNHSNFAASPARLCCAFVVFLLLQSSAAKACEAQSDVQAGANSTTVTKQDCADQVVPATPQKQLPAIPSVGVKTDQASPPPDAAPNPTVLQPAAMPPPPKVDATAPAKSGKPKLRHKGRAVMKRLRKPAAPKAETKPMFWWHTQQ